LQVVVVLPEPCRPTIMIATGGHCVEVDGLAVGAERGDQFVMTIFTTIWPGVTDLTTVAPIACSRTFR
jgi:hypothetical protein